MTNITPIGTAVDLLRRGGIVAFPTETVYGLGADATNSEAVRRIFAAKGRPATNPLIVHVARVETARGLAAVWPPIADELAEWFWPGPLTIVLPRRSGPGRVVDEVTAGRDTVGLRIPNHPVALDLLQRFGGPVAAPSANRSNGISPTAAEHVRADLGYTVDCILDGGPCAVGLESTVLDLSTGRPTILRPGGVGREWIEAVIGPADMVSAIIDPHQSSISPGQHARHYSPRTPAFRFESCDGGKVAEKFVGGKVFRLSAKDADPNDFGRELYSTLRRADEAGFDALLIELPPDAPAWSAVRDRLTRAARAWEESA